ncbi:MAG: SDR family NAD(P)-dependent oxidoreductase [Canibacter sp.]
MTGLPDLTGQNILITGANGGLGRVLARIFVSAGARVACHARTESRARETLEFLNLSASQAVPVWGELTTSTGQIVDQTVAHLGELHGVINNAGLQPVEPFEAVDRDAWNQVLDVNLSAVHDLTRVASAVLPRGGWVTHIASIEGVRPATGHAHYAAAKAGLIMHAKAAALELGPRGIRVNAVSPGLIERPGIGADWPEGVAQWKSHAPLGELIPPEHVAAACVMLASPASGSITGHNLVVDAGMLATPGW